MRRWDTKQAGFTIVELLIVIVVIAILAAIIIVSYTGISESARVSVAKNYAAQLKHRDIVYAVGYWTFDECSGGTVTNSATMPAGNTVVGTANWSTDTPSGTGCSFSFNGTSYINTGVLLSNEYYMKSAWIKSSSEAASQNIVSDVTDNNTAFYLSSGKPSAGHNGIWNHVASGINATDGKWHFVTVEFVRNGTDATGTMTMTIDGKTIGTNAAVPIMNNPSTSTQLIGAYLGSSRFVGLIDEVMIVTK